MNRRELTATELGLLGCHCCGLVSRPTLAIDDVRAHRCPRCGTHLHARKPHSIGRAWACWIAAAILYLPANLLPIMNTSSLFDSQRDTIMSGVIFLWHEGDWPLAALVFFASIMVPMLKLIAIAYLLVTVQIGKINRRHQRARLYRLLEFVGRWSMLDIYVVTILVALVHLQSLALIEAGPGALAFGAVVVLTMLSAMSFDPRLIWDHRKEKDVRHAP
ncbi:MAG TPA: paraquat-inducible protein A [Rhodocyclaceae bacterium]|nr:paraquat-inducible protein A [Rhodocyclaceae bacterium]HMZ83916.1 paraquat-inducible protein A [Rhodocyclaceae bacterium]HNA03573.1 paraquat-inducible protein A [Rhodocyclaceae bacterium]HNB77657.1 paraquat-inducible protein A [Rhodocyclaceae bacterium]HNC61464.1 paraquat-inducible protein A [Rhodocyclaceae bacterium]